MAGLLALASLSFALARAHYASGAWALDFRAFYCAGAAVAEHRDPYLTEPLRSCENAVRGFQPGRGLPFALPAPLPGYALAPFVLLSRLPFSLASALWALLLCASFASTVALLARMSALGAGTVVAALALGTAYSISIGQIVPIVCAAAVAAAYFVSRGHDRSAALAAALATIEPHLGLPICLALFVARPRARIVLLACGGILAALSVGLLGIAANVEFVRDVLPAHALSEISNEEQYSLSYVAHLAGLDERVAGALGTFSYLAMLAVGIVAGRAAAVRTGRDALLVLVPAALAVLGGPFVHVQQLAIALPAALVLCGLRGREARACAFAVVLLAVPWTANDFLTLNLPVVAGVALVLALDLFELSPRAAAFAGLAAALSIALLGAISVNAPVVLAPYDPRDGAALAETGWRAVSDANFHANVVPRALTKMLGWCGLILIAVAALGRRGTLERRPG